MGYGEPDRTDGGNKPIGIKEHYTHPGSIRTTDLPKPKDDRILYPISVAGTTQLFDPDTGNIMNVPNDKVNASDVVCKSDRPSLKHIVDAVVETINNKNDQYTTDPISVLSLDDLLTQIKIKAVRAKFTNNNEKRYDELLDIVVYCILTMEKLELEG